MQVTAGRLTAAKAATIKVKKVIFRMGQVTKSCADDPSRYVYARGAKNPRLFLSLRNCMTAVKGIAKKKAGSAAGAARTGQGKRTTGSSKPKPKPEPKSEGGGGGGGRGAKKRKASREGGGGAADRGNPKRKCGEATRKDAAKQNARVKEEGAG